MGVAVRRRRGVSAHILDPNKPNICTCASCCTARKDRKALRELHLRELRVAIGRRSFVSHTS